jgi:chromosome segregation ATPase
MAYNSQNAVLALSPPLPPLAPKPSVSMLTAPPGPSSTTHGDARATQTQMIARAALRPALDTVRAALVAEFEQALASTATHLGQFAEQRNACVHAADARAAVAHVARESAEHAAHTARTEADALARTLDAERKARTAEKAQLAQLAQAHRDTVETFSAERLLYQRTHDTLRSTAAERDADRARACALQQELAAERQRTADADALCAAITNERDAARAAAGARRGRGGAGSARRVPADSVGRLGGANAGWCA